MADPTPSSAAENAHPQHPQSPLLDSAFLRHLEQLELVSRKIFLGRMKGERRSKKRGVSIEFADYRDYTKGDDLRFLDWNIYGRLDRLFTKLFHEEEDLYLYLIIDTSASMNHGTPNKAWFAKRAAAALAYIALAGLDRVCLVGFGGDDYRWMQPTRGKSRIWSLVDFLENLPLEGDTHLTEGCRRFAMQQRQGGLVVLLSDLMDPNGYEQAFKNILQKRNDLFVLQTLSPQELHPDLAGALRLLDIETGEPVEITVNEELLATYSRRLKAYQTQIKQACSHYGIHFIPVSTEQPVDHLLSSAFRKLGLIE